MATVKAYKTTAPPPLMDGPQGVMQYTLLVSAATKAEAAALVGLKPRDLEWVKGEPHWVVHRALVAAGLLAGPGEAYFTDATRGDRNLVHRKTADGWVLVGSMAGDWPDPYLDTEHREG